MPEVQSETEQEEEVSLQSVRKNDECILEHIVCNLRQESEKYSCIVCA